MGNGSDQDSVRAAAIRRLDRAKFDLERVVKRDSEAQMGTYAKSEDFLLILYPDGVRPDQYRDVLALVRMFDHMLDVANGEVLLGGEPYLRIGALAVLTQSDKYDGAIIRHLEGEEDVVAEEMPRDFDAG